MARRARGSDTLPRMPLRPQSVCIGIMLLGVLVPTPAAAHEAGLSRGRYTLGVDHIDAEVSVALRDARAMARQLDSDDDGELSAAEWQTGYATLVEQLSTGVTWRLGTEGCRYKHTELVAAGDDGLTMRGRYQCPKDLDPSLMLDVAGILQAADAGHRHIAEVTGIDGRVTAYAGHRVAFTFYPLKARPQAKSVATPEAAERGGSPPSTRGSTPTSMYIHEGLAHVLSGWDHVAFICGLVLVFRSRQQARPRQLVGWVSGFTLGHCLSLMAATVLGFVADARWVEPLIALSLAHLGWQILVRSQTPLAWLVTGFGLVHGLGFAGALASLGIAGVAGFWPMLLFNVGVEVGQLMLVIAMLLATALLERTRQPWVTRLLAWALVGFGVLAAVFRLLAS